MLRTLLALIVLLVAQQARADEKEVTQVTAPTKYLEFHLNCFMKLGLLPDEDFDIIIHVTAVKGKVDPAVIWQVGLYDTPRYHAAKAGVQVCKANWEKIKVTAR